MTREEVIIELEQMYMMLSEEKKKAIDEAIKALQAQADGEYISKDKMLMFLNDMRYGIAPDETVADGDERREREAQVDVLDDLMEVVEQMPSVAIPNKVGHWIKYGKLYQCSECKELSCCQGKFCNECGCPMEIDIDGMASDKLTTEDGEPDGVGQFFCP